MGWTSGRFRVRGTLSRWFNGQGQYTLSRGYNDTNGIGSFPANDYDLPSEWARADFDRRHRFNMVGRTTMFKAFDLGMGLSMNTGGPYNETLGPDLLNNGRGRARGHARVRRLQRPGVRHRGKNDTMSDTSIKERVCDTH